MSKLKITVVLSLALFLLCWAFPPAGYAQSSLGLKFFGVYGSIGPGDVYEGLKGPMGWYEQVFELNGYSASGGFKNFKTVWEAGGDLIFYFTPVIGIGLGSGYMQTLPAKTNMTFTKPAEPDLFMSMEPRVTAVPIRASLYVSIPAGSVLNLSLHGGVSYYFARMDFTWRLGTETDWLQVAAKSESKGLGFHGGAGVELKISTNTALVVEAVGQVAKISGFTGDTTLSASGGGSVTTSGTLYYWKYDRGPLGIIPEVGIRETEPSGTHYSDVRKAEVDLGGFSVRAGFVIWF